MTIKSLDIPKDQINSVIELYSNGQIQEALDALGALIKDYPNEPVPYNIRGACYAALGHLDEAATKYSTAISLYRTLDQQWPNQPRLAAHLAMVRMKQGRLVEAEAILISGLSGDGGIVKHMPLRNSYSTLLYEQGRYIDAINMGKLSLLLIS